MGKLEERKDGFFVLDAVVGSVHIKKVFTESEKTIAEVAEEPKQGGFYLDIPDIVPGKDGSTKA